MATPLGTSSARSDDEADGRALPRRLRRRPAARARLVRRPDRSSSPARVPARATAASSTTGSRARRRRTARRACAGCSSRPTPSTCASTSSCRKGWGWTGRPYHPHLMHFLTTENDKYHGPAASHLTLYIEPQEGKLRLAAQDIQNKDKPHGLTQGPLRGGYNGTFYDSKDVLFTDDAWHCVEAHVPAQHPRPRTGSAQRGRRRARLVRRQARRRAHGRGPPLDRLPGDEVQPVPARALLRPRPAAPRADAVDRRAGRREEAIRWTAATPSRSRTWSGEACRRPRPSTC